MPLDRPVPDPVRIGDWTIDPASGSMTRGDAQVRLEERAVRLLLCLAARPGEVVSIDDLLKAGWQSVIVSHDSVYQAITALRRQLGDDPRQPSYIATVPRRGYRLVATVSAPVASGSPAATADPAAAQPAPASVALPAALRSSPQRIALIGKVTTVAMLAVGLAMAFAVVRTRQEGPASTSAQGRAAAVATRSIAVLPLRDLTDAMSEEPFADGMTEELINRLSALPDVAVAPAASSFYYKERQVTLAELASALKVAYVLEGSVRKSGATLRVSARLMRVSDGFVAWSGSYDRAWTDKLMIQDDIAGEVSKALAKPVY